MSRRGWLLFLTVGVVWGFPYLLIKVAVSGFTPLSVVFIRTAIGAAVLLPLVAWRGELRPVLRRWRPLALFTVVEIAVPWFLLSDAERRLTSSLSGLLIAMLPLVTALLGWLTGIDERIDVRRLAGLLVGFSGVAVLVGFDVGRSDLWAAGEIVLVTIGYAIGPLIISRWLGSVSGTAALSVAFALTAVLYVAPALLQLSHASPPADAVAAVVVLGVVCTALGFPVFFALIHEVGPVRAAVIAYVNPAVAILAGVLVLHEPFGPTIAAGFLLIIAGSVLATHRGRARPPAPLAPESRATSDAYDAVAPG